ncbi:MAG: type II secretion system F family protein, partial [Candidatus Nanopelagicales bacterium]
MTTNVQTWIAASWAAGCVAMLYPASRARLRLASHVNAQRTRSLVTWRALGMVSVAIATASVVGGGVGIAIGAAVAVGLHRWLVSLPLAAQVEQKQHRQRELPVVVDLMAACLSAGAHPADVAEAVSKVARSSLQLDLNQVGAALRVGASSDEAWRLVAESDLAAVAQVMVRSSRSGAPASELLMGVATELRAASRAAALADTRR